MSIKNPKQLTLIEQFDKSRDHHILFVEKLIDFIKLVKYYRTCTTFSDSTEKLRHERLAVLQTILYWLAQLAFRVSRGLPKFDKEGFGYFQDLTKDKVFLNMVEYIPQEQLIEFYTSGSKRARTLFILARNVIKDDIEIGTRVIENFDKLIRSNAV